MGHKYRGIEGEIQELGDDHKAHKYGRIEIDVQERQTSVLRKRSRTETSSLRITFLRLGFF
jgi:hypothetical protein